jgi:hypothetical protein
MNANRDIVTRPTTVAVSPTISAAIGFTLVKSAWRFGKYHSASRTVCTPTRASLSIVD